jgi:uncharacterized pyridoxal phosphate-containing UPF0001 family protein
LFAERLDEVRQRIARAGGAPGQVTIVAVTKGFGSQAVRAAVAGGITDIGENYAQELLSKASEAPAGVRWHFLGALQRNKLTRLASYVQLWHGLDAEDQARALARRCPGAAVLVQVRQPPGGPLPRRGVDSSHVPAVVEAARSAGLDVRGLMALGPLGAGPSEVRGGFREVARLARRLGLRELSMGMSADFELAVAEGATIVRLGQVLFGPRGSPGEHSVAHSQVPPS